METSKFNNLVAFFWIQRDGTTSSDFVLINGKLIQSNDKANDKFIKQSYTIEKEGRTIYSDNHDECVVKKYKSVYLIRLLSLKTDSYGRRLPIMILVENLNQNNSNILRSYISKSLDVTEYNLDKYVLSELLEILRLHFKKIKIYKISLVILFFFLLSIILFLNKNN